jgi:Na+-translocating ferredoxin:NAD+ oxidoreductase RnfG subunit
VTDAYIETILGVRVVASKETPGFGERIKDRPAPRSLVGALLGRSEKSRVVLEKGGALVGRISEKDDGSVAVVLPDGTTQLVPADEVRELTAAPFPAAFIDQFTGIPAGKAQLAQNGGVVDGLVGATITSRAVTGGVAAAVDFLKKAVAAE